MTWPVFLPTTTASSKIPQYCIGCSLCFGDIFQCSRIHEFLFTYVTSPRQGDNDMANIYESPDNIEWIIYSDGIKFEYLILGLISWVRTQFIYGNLVDPPTQPTASRQYKCANASAHTTNMGEKKRVLGESLEIRIDICTVENKIFCGKEQSITT